jgi:hypothetical protein
MATCGYFAGGNLPGSLAEKSFRQSGGKPFGDFFRPQTVASAAQDFENASISIIADLLTTRTLRRTPPGAPPLCGPEQSGCPGSHGVFGPRFEEIKAGASPCGGVLAVE